MKLINCLIIISLLIIQIDSKGAKGSSGKSNSGKSNSGKGSGGNSAPVKSKSFIPKAAIPFAAGLGLGAALGVGFDGLDRYEIYQKDNNYYHDGSIYRTKFDTNTNSTEYELNEVGITLIVFATFIGFIFISCCLGCFIKDLINCCEKKTNYEFNRV